METPNTQAGRYTEEVMAKVREVLPLHPGEESIHQKLQAGLTTFQYNRVWEAVYHWLDSFDFGENPEEAQPDPSRLQRTGCRSGKSQRPKLPAHLHQTVVRGVSESMRAKSVVPDKRAHGHPKTCGGQ